MKWFLKKFGFARTAGLVLMIAMLALRIADPIFVEVIRNQAFDYYQRLKPRHYKPAPVIIVDIDEKSLEKYGQWPWPRTLLAKLVQKLAKNGTAAMAFDIVFAEADRLSPNMIAVDNIGLSKAAQKELKALPSNDEAFAFTIARARVVLGQTSTRSADDEKNIDQEMAKAQYAFLGPDPRPFMYHFPEIVQNMPQLEKNASGRGIFTVKPDADGIFRKVPLVMVVKDHIRLSLSAELLRIATGGKAFAIKSNEAGIDGVVLARKLVKTDANGVVWPYFSPHLQSRYISAADILDGKVGPQQLRGRLAFIGTSAVGLEDYRATPMGTSMPGVEIHAQLIENILSGELLFRPNYAIGIELAAILGICLLTIALVPSLGALWSMLVAAVIVGSYLGYSYYAFAQHRALIDPTFPVAAALAMFMLLGTANYIREEQKRRQIRGAFGQYISPHLVEQLAKDPDKLVLGGETKDLSVLFSDVRGFTPISESYKDNPHGLTVLMNKFLTKLSEAAMRFQGTIDKFMGDAIMVFWNAPLDDPDHALNACKSALAMLEDVDALNKKMLQDHEALLAAGEEPEAPYHAINIGIGVNSGTAVVGNMGSENRFDYTALGDTVNIAARLEGQSKPYGIKIVLGENTAHAVEGKMATIELDLIRVKGKKEPQRIYGLFGDEKLLKDQKFREFAQANLDMLAHYRAQTWREATESLKNLRKLNSELKLDCEGYFGLYEQRIQEFSTNPPPEDWDGVYTATSK